MVVSPSNRGADWESLEYHQAFSNSEAYKSFMVSLGWAFKLENAAPLMSMEILAIVVLAFGFGQWLNLNSVYSLDIKPFSGSPVTSDRNSLPHTAQRRWRRSENDDRTSTGAYHGKCYNDWQKLGSCHRLG